MTWVIAKIEKPEAVLNIDAIIQVSDGVMVARGDLGVEMAMEKVPVIQKSIVKKCNAAAKPVIIATQTTESMIVNYRPTRYRSQRCGQCCFRRRRRADAECRNICKRISGGDRERDATHHQ